MKTFIILMLLISLGACKKSEDSGSSKNPTSPPNNPTPEPPTPEPPEPSTPPPTISEITGVQKVYKVGEEVEFVVTFSKAVKVVEEDTPFLSLNVGGQTRQANFRRESGESDTEASFFYEVQSNDNDNDGITLEPTLDLNGGSIRDTSDQDLVNTIPQKYQSFPDVKVDTLHPTISSVATAIGSTLFSPNAIVDLVATFNEPVKVTGVPSLTLSVGGSSASANYQDKGESYSPTHTFRYIAEDNHSGSIQVTGLSVDSSHSIRDGVENQIAEQTYPAPFSVGEITLEARSCDYTVTSGFNGGDGSESSPYLICTYAQLDKMRDSLTAHYELGQDVDASPSWSAGVDGCTAYDGSTVPTTNACTGWVSVGTGRNNECDGEVDDVCFQGYLNGGGHIISNLYMNISVVAEHHAYSGLFGSMGTESEIANIGLTDTSVTLTVDTVTDDTTDTTANFYGGGLVGNKHGGTISNSYSKGGAVTVSSSISPPDICYSHGGGLVGNQHSGVIRNSYAGAVVTASSLSAHTYGGGLAGYNQGTISDSYATGAVTTTTSHIYINSYGGGLVGTNNNGTISNSYATGAVVTTSSNPSGPDSGGLVGFSSGTISGTHYFVHNSGGDNGIDSGDCSGTCTKKTLAELQALTSTDVTDWSTDNWDFGTTTQLPRLKYAPTATYCSDDTYTTQQTCEEASKSWVIEGCGGDTGVTCGDVISRP